ncbi:MAG: helix-turn-helix transcriptional regulator [Alphaproteobacteria bacterium]|nr:helix-turn-helix transcriptional regulator [Alphaproteobacteria bacterium]
MITAAQLRAARGLLDWTRSDLAKAANISPETIKNIEHGTFRPQENTADAIIKAFAAHDVEFTKDDGVRRHKDPIKIFSGTEGFGEMLDHVLTVVRQNPISRHLALADTYALTAAPETIRVFSDAMSKIPHLDAKCLVWEGDINMPFAYCQYRWLKKSNVWVKPFYVYGNWVGFVMNTGADSFMGVSISSELLAKDMREQFDALWNNADMPKVSKSA